MEFNNNSTIAVVGLGYVGLPLALAFGARNKTIGFDLKIESIKSFQDGIDPNGEARAPQFTAAKYIEFTAEARHLARADFIIVAVPTPIDQARQPDLSPLLGAAETVGRHIRKGSVIIFESTVYPGVTEDECVPVLEKSSGLKWLEDFNIGYSPERINPGDEKHTLARIVKVVSGDTPETLKAVAALYASVVTAGVHQTSSIKEAEAAKVIENTQRDLNIALMNELSLIFDRLGIDTSNVLEAAGTKWNFLPFRPGLVGGHCIGVDPYYLTYKAESIGYHPEVILAGRRINDNMGKFIAEKAVKMMLNSSRRSNSPGRIGILGLTFKENCPDLRNSKVFDIIKELESYSMKVMVHDPLVNPAEAQRFFGMELHDWEELHDLDALIFAVPHKDLLNLKISELAAALAPGGCLLDIKSVLDLEEINRQQINFWRL
ncbi:nucleotide sugar dehydrogenase [Desulfobacterota bacterium M19]